MAAVGFSGRNGLQWSSELTDIDELSPSQSVYYALFLQLRCVIQGASKLHDFKDERSGEEKLLSGSTRLRVLAYCLRAHRVCFLVCLDALGVISISHLNFPHSRKVVRDEPAPLERPGQGRVLYG